MAPIFASTELVHTYQFWLLNGLLSPPLPRPSSVLPPCLCGFQLLPCRFFGLLMAFTVIEHCCW